MNIHTLTLADERSTIRSQFEDLLLRELPDSFVNRFYIFWNTWDVLYRAIVRDDHVLHPVVPEVEVDELLQQPRADNLELSSKDTTSVNVAIIISARCSQEEANH